MSLYHTIVSLYHTIVSLYHTAIVSYCLQLVLSEEDVWRSVIRWGENQAGCSGGYSQWTDDDRLNVKEVGGATNFAVASHDLPVGIIRGD